MSFKMEFETRNVAFFDGDADPDPYTVSTIIRVISGLILSGMTSGDVKDADHNKVGTWEYNPKD